MEEKQASKNAVPSPVYVGTAGWTLSKEYAAAFPMEGTHLARYAQRLCGVEINSSFYKPHRHATYVRWAASVPHPFRFAVKLPREITHRRKLVNAILPLESFLAQVAGLGINLGPLLVQLPPSLPFDAQAASAFFAELRTRFTGSIVCEPRHAGWFSPQAEGMLAGLHIARVAADPAPVPQAAHPGGWPGLVYYRLHGAPRMYYSAYAEETLRTQGQQLRAGRASAPAWCIFDNTASGAATGDALSVAKQLE